MDADKGIAKNFLKSFVICDADVLCPCGAFCHGRNSKNAYIFREESNTDFVFVLENYSISEINNSLKSNNIPARLETIFIEEKFYTAERMLESEAINRKNDVSAVKKRNADYKKTHKDQPPIAYCVTTRLGSIEIEYHAEEVYDVIGTTTEYYDEPIYEETTKYRTEKYIVNERRTKLIDKRERIEKTIKKTEYVPIYNTWAKKWEQRAYDSYVPHFEYKTTQVPCEYDYPVEKTRQVPYKEKIQTGTKKCSREIPKYGYVTKKIPYRYCTPLITPFYVYLIPLPSCKSCRCVFCIGTLQENSQTLMPTKEQWIDHLNKTPNNNCLACLGYHKNHDTHYNAMYMNHIHFQPQLLQDTHFIFSGNKNNNPEIQKSYNCFQLFGYQSGKPGRKYIQKYSANDHECCCILCLRERNNCCLVKCFTANNYLTDAAFEDLVRQLAKVYPFMVSFTMPEANIKIRPLISAKLRS